jgi:hypothetical protein
MILWVTPAFYACVNTYLCILLTYVLILWIRVLLEKLTSPQLVKKFPTFYGARTFITAFTRARHVSLSWARSIHSVPHSPSHYLKIHLNVPFPLLRSYQSISPDPRHGFMFRNKASFCYEELSALDPNPKLQDHPLSTVRDILFCIFAATVHIGGRSSTRSLRTRHSVGDRNRLIIVDIDIWLAERRK